MRSRGENDSGSVDGFLRSVLDSLPDRIAVVDQSGIVVWANEAWAANGLPSGSGETGIDYPAVLERARDAGDASAGECHRGLCDVLARRQTVFESEYSCPGPAGQRWFVMRIKPLDLAGTTGAVISHSDVTERKRAGLAREESEALLESIIDNIPVGILVKDSGHVVELANGTYLRWYGFDSGVMVGRRSDEIEDFQSGEEAAFMNAQEREVLSSGRIVTRQVERPFADGRVHIVSITKFPVYDLQGRIIKVGSASVDLTEQVKARRALARSEMRFRDFAESASDWLWEMDENLCFSYFSERFREIAGYTPSEVLGRPRTAFTPEDHDSEKWRQHLSDLQRHRPFRDFRYDLEREDGSVLTISISGRPVFDEAGNFRGYRGTGSDITEQRRAEEARDSALEEAERANRAKSEFLATMSHELRTPLNAIIGFSDVLFHQYFGPPGEGKYREYAGDIQRSAEHLLELVNDLLDISAIEAGRTEIEKEALAIGEMIEDCVNSVIEKLRSKGVALVLAVPDGLPALLADRRAIKQVLLNLLSNAAKFTPPGGSIQVSATVSDGQGEIVVADTGEGIPEDLLARISRPFTRAERDPFKTEKGWGLGLAIARSLVELHDGELKIASEIGRGTTITVRLPNRAS